MDTLFFIASKVIWLLISPDNLILIFIILSLFLLYIGKQKLAKHILSTVTVLLITLSFLPVGEWLLYPLESRFQNNPVLPEKIDGIIVLSGAEDTERSYLWKQVELGSAAERDFSFLTLARKYPNAKLVFTGGTGSLMNQEYKAADVAKILFEQQGIDSTKITFERESRNTYENVIYSKNIVNPIKNENWILITTAWHMPRSVGIFCKTGWPVTPYPVDHQTKKGKIFRVNYDLLNNLSLLKTSIKEWVGLLAYYLTGKTTSFVPEQCK